ncbi:asparaginase-domain-containing protein [Coniochaeta sp. 2T2.1]|nr:asparaginase-domain-containing protein [Coniochaeta sp. 2T2.1]
MQYRTWAVVFVLLTRHEVVTQLSSGLPLVINTWGGPFTAATDAAYEALLSNEKISALDAVEIGCKTCEREQCDGTIGYGGSPDENCETTLDAMIMDGDTMNTGAVAGLRRIKDAISVARHVMDYTTHSLLSGDLATQFAVENGFKGENLTTPESAALCAQWKTQASCQPNYRVNVSPNPTTACGPYLSPPRSGVFQVAARRDPNYPLVAPDLPRPRSHDTISMVAIHASGTMAAGTSTNGASHKVPGWVGDGPIVGSGSYVDGEVGGCGATGDGDVMMRFLPCYQAVESLRLGMTPREAAEDAGNHGGAASGWTFTYALRGGGMNAAQVVQVPPLNPPGS